MSFTMDDIDQALQTLQLVKDIKQGEIHIDNGELQLSVWKGDAGDSAGSPVCFAKGDTIAPPAPVEQKAAPAAVPATAVKEEPEVVTTTTEAEKQEEIEEGLVAIKASMISIFYRKPSPDDPPFVEVGSEVEEDTVVCLLEVMKCFRSINAGVKGRIEKICAETGQLVEVGEVLFLVRPD